MRKAKRGEGGYVPVELTAARPIPLGLAAPVAGIRPPYPGRDANKFTNLGIENILSGPDPSHPIDPCFVPGTILSAAVFPFAASHQMLLGQEQLRAPKPTQSPSLIGFNLLSC